MNFHIKISPELRKAVNWLSAYMRKNNCSLTIAYQTYQRTLNKK